MTLLRALWSFQAYALAPEDKSCCCHVSVQGRTLARTGGTGSEQLQSRQKSPPCPYKALLPAPSILLSLLGWLSLFSLLV